MQENRDPTPFISITSDLLRACNRAAHLERDGSRNISIIMIDGWNLNKEQVVYCKTLRRVSGLPEHNLFDTEYLVWQCIPGHAIVRKWSWDTICSSLGKLFPALRISPSFPMHQKRSLQHLRDQLCLPDPNIAVLVGYLVDDLGLMSQNLTTKQIALMVIGWSRSKSDIWRYYRLEGHLQALIPKQLAELDYHLYANTCQWNVRHQSSFVKTSPCQNVESLMVNLNIARNFNLPTYEDWLTARNDAEEMECVTAHGADSGPLSLLHLLKSNNLEVPVLTFRRPPVRWSRQRHY